MGVGEWKKGQWQPEPTGLGPARRRLRSGHPGSRLGMHRDPEGLADELLPSPGPKPWRRPLIMWESRDLATFHPQPVEHGAAVHHIQHGATGPQAGEDLEDKDGGA